MTRHNWLLGDIKNWSLSTGPLRKPERAASSIACKMKVLCAGWVSVRSSEKFAQLRVVCGDSTLKTSRITLGPTESSALRERLLSGSGLPSAAGQVISMSCCSTELFATMEDKALAKSVSASGAILLLMIRLFSPRILNLSSSGIRSSCRSSQRQSNIVQDLRKPFIFIDHELALLAIFLPKRAYVELDT
jgi:hypothetical protein